MTIAVESTEAGNGAPPREGKIGLKGAYVLFALLLVYTLNFIDRTIIGALAEPIKTDLQLSDWQVGLLGGLAFSLFYSILGIPIARLAEQYSRVRIISTAVALWSIMTAVCGLATNFTQLLLFRLGVGVGEAGCTPPAHSLISDYFPPSQRATALGIYSLGIPIGLLFGAIAGGWIAQEFGWRLAFMMVGLPGVAIAILLRLTVKEPERRRDLKSEEHGESIGAEPVPNLLVVARTMSASRRVVFIFVAYMFIGIGSFSISLFGVPFLLRGTDLSLFEAATAFGLVVGIGSFIGTGSGGYLADRVARGGRFDRLFLPGLALIVAAATYVVALYSASLLILGILVFVATVLKELYTGPALGAVLNSVAPRMRARASALLLFVINLVGLGLGPLIIGALSDGFARSALIRIAGEEATCSGDGMALFEAACHAASYSGLQNALAVAGALYAIGGGCLLLAGRAPKRITI